MRMQVNCGGSYKLEVEAGSFSQAVAVAFRERLPMAIGELISVREENRKRKSGWGVARYTSSAGILKTIGATGLYLPTNRGFRLNTDHPKVKEVPEHKAG